MQVHLVVIDTAGKQRYIFSSTKRQEIVGASELIAQVEGTWAEAALAEVFNGFSREHWRIENDDAELLVAGAGGMTALVRDPARGRALVTEVTRRALADAPGLDVCGVVTRGFTWDGADGLADAIRAARAGLPAVRAARPAPEARFARLPIVDECSASGLPAKELRRPAADEPEQPRSAASVAKLGAYESALARLAGAVRAKPGEEPRKAMRQIVDHLSNAAEWVAVVHADGNGLGGIFSEFEQLVLGGTARDYSDALRFFSTEVDACALAAVRDAIGHAAALRDVPLFGGLPPVLPLVFGGDDLTVVCDGAVALPFTRRYLERFAGHATQRVGEFLAKAQFRRLGAAAGVAIVKRHYPFHFAYDLAEELTTREAKRVKDKLGPDHGAVAFHVLYESSAPDLKRLRAHTSSDGAQMVAQPYVVGDQPDDPWARGRHWNDLERRVDALRRRDPETGERLLPSGAVHDLREGLFLGVETATARLELLRRRYSSDQGRKAALADLGGFWDDAGRVTTGLLDAMNAAEFLREEEGASDDR